MTLWTPLVQLCVHLRVHFFACLNCTCLHCYLFVNVSKKLCVWVCTHSVILVPILSDAHWEKQIHSEKQIVPLLWVWSSHKEKGQSKKTKEWESCQVQYVLSFPLFHYLSIHSFKVYTWTVFSLLPLPPALICMPSLGEKNLYVWQWKWISVLLNILITENFTVICWGRIFSGNPFILKKTL